MQETGQKAKSLIDDLLEEIKRLNIENNLLKSMIQPTKLVGKYTEEVYPYVFGKEFRRNEVDQQLDVTNYVANSTTHVMEDAVGNKAELPFKNITQTVSPYYDKYYINYKERNKNEDDSSN